MSDPTDTDEQVNLPSGNGPYERLTVLLTSESSSSLRYAANTTGDNLTDTVNRALQTYDLMANAVANGGQVIVRYADGSEVHGGLIPNSGLET
jgi:hypothetical protein